MYFDGSHYIAIPHTENKRRYRPKPKEEKITVVEQKEGGSETEQATEPLTFDEDSEQTDDEQIVEDTIDEPQTENKPVKTERKLTRKELFEELYAKYIDLSKRERQKRIVNEMTPYFDSVERTKLYVQANFERKWRNVVCRRVRMTRKANLAHFNYFCTFTYDSEKHTEESFRKSLKNCLAKFCSSKGWKYMGVWERSPEKKRLHFHGLFYIPENTMPSPLIEVKDYSTKEHKMQVSIQSIYFNERFGRSDFKELNPLLLGESLAYLMKYIEKSGEKIVYSKGLYQYFISDIMDEDIVCPIGQEDKKLLLFDNFNCWDEGTLIGRVSPEVIEQMRKTN